MADSGCDDIRAVARESLPGEQVMTPSASASLTDLKWRLLVKRTSWHLPLRCAGAALIGTMAWSDQQGLVSLALLLLLPVLIGGARSRLGAFLVANFYYGTATRAVPGIIGGFFPGLPVGANVTVWAAHSALLALPWAIALQPRRDTPFCRALGTAAALVLLTIPPLGLFHWGSPLMAAGLLFPGWKWVGVSATLTLLALMAASRRRTTAVHVGIAALVLLAVIANMTFHVSPSPDGWRAVSLHFGKSPELWSEEMVERRRFLAETAAHALKQGDKVVVFPESISGSSRRSQAALWHGVVEEARSRGATVLVGEEVWNKDKTGFKNALVGYGVYGGDGAVVVSSQVPMPIGDWKFGYEEGAETNIFGSDVVALQGRRVAFSVCYEDFLLWPHRGLLAGHADLLISTANQWPSSGTSAETSQDISRLALARLTGVPLLIAKNH